MKYNTKKDQIQKKAIKKSMVYIASQYVPAPDVVVAVKTTKKNREILEKLQQIAREPSQMPVKELTPELSEKLYTQIMQKLHDQQVAKEHVLHHLKQLKASIGRMKGKASKKYRINDLNSWFGGIHECNQLVDKLIAKIKGQTGKAK